MNASRVDNDTAHVYAVQRKALDRGTGVGRGDRGCSEGIYLAHQVEANGVGGAMRLNGVNGGRWDGDPAQEAEAVVRGGGFVKQGDWTGREVIVIGVIGHLAEPRCSRRGSSESEINDEGE